MDHIHMDIYLISLESRELDFTKINSYPTTGTSIAAPRTCNVLIPVIVTI